MLNNTTLENIDNAIQFHLPFLTNTSIKTNDCDNSPKHSDSSDSYDVVININPDVSVKIDNIQEEENLIEYADNHFTNKVNDDVLDINNRIYSLENVDDFDDDFHHQYVRSNSPITVSNHGSDSHGSGSGSDSYDDGHGSDSHGGRNDGHHNIKHKSKHITYNDVDKIIDKYYDSDIDNKFSNELDIMTTYIKGQKNLYIQSKYLTQKKLHCLMIPALILSAAITIIAPFIECGTWSVGLFISAINAIIALLLSIINYMKLESSCETYLQIANNYDKLETSLDLANNKIGFMENNIDKNTLVLNKLREVEKAMSEIKDMAHILIPDEIKMLFPIICNINIFSFIKKIEVYKKNLIIKFKDVKNEIRYILRKWQKDGQKNEQKNNHIDKLKEKNRLMFLYKVKDKLKTEIMDYRNTYGCIDEIFTKEIKMAESNKMSFYRCILCNFCKPNVKPNYLGNNPVVDKYFRFIFVDE
jgi:hypothetical protein